jgi:hypothetical protein
MAHKLSFSLNRYSSDGSLGWIGKNLVDEKP